ncbi:MAG: flagellar hook-associated protein FlgK [Lachnospiraceae bacterium]|nr:flagellar hook-associated protein FlgK [Lachnospiraceae bacterium]
MPLMGSLYIGQSGLQTSQNLLNTTAHNMSNLDTTGYTRQQSLLGDKEYTTIKFNGAGVSNQQIGLGVTYSKVRQVRDIFLDQTYRKESGRSMFYSTSYEVMTEVENILGELYGITFSKSLGEDGGLQEAIDELAKTPSDSVVQGLVVQRATAFLENAQAVYNGISDYQDNLNLKVKSQVDKINEYGKKIHDLNIQILKVESGGIESANDLRDTRNLLLDELSEMAKISYKEDVYGNVLVQLEGHDFVSRDLVYEIGLDQDNTTGFYTPFWTVDASYTINSEGKKEYDIEGAEVFNLTQTVSSDLNTDIGGLKAILLARGDHRADYTDLQDKNQYNRDISQSILMNVQAEFDQLIHQVTTGINKVLENAADTETGYLCEQVEVDGQLVYRPIQLFQKRATDGFSYEKDNDGNITGVVYNEEDPENKETLYTTSNLMINPALLKEPTLLGMVKPDGSEDYQTAAALLQTFKDEGMTLNPNLTTKLNYADYYSDLVGQISNSGSVFKKISESQADTVEATSAAREQIVGVSSDEELNNMIRFQNAYNASSRYINVINEMLEHLLNSLA